MQTNKSTPFWASSSAALRKFVVMAPVAIITIPPPTRALRMGIDLPIAKPFSPD